MLTHPALAACAAPASLPPCGAILALDLGTTTGWAIRTAEGVILSGTVSFRPSRYDGGGMRYLRFRPGSRSWPRTPAGSRPIWFEEVRRHLGTDAAHVYGGLLAILTAWAEQEPHPLRGRAGRHHQAPRHRPGQCRQAGRDRGHAGAGLQPGRRQRGGCAGAPALGHRDPRRRPVSGMRSPEGLWRPAPVARPGEARRLARTGPARRLGRRRAAQLARARARPPARREAVRHPEGGEDPWAEWTRAQVEDRLESAADVMRALPGVKPQGYFSAWPEYLHTFADKVGQEPRDEAARGRRRGPSRRPRRRCSGCAGWSRSSASSSGPGSRGTEWKPICWQFGISRPTAHRRWEYGLSVIVWRLNGRRVPTKRGRRYVVEEVSRPACPER